MGVSSPLTFGLQQRKQGQVQQQLCLLERPLKVHISFLQRTDFVSYLFTSCEKQGRL